MIAAAVACRRKCVLRQRDPVVDYRCGPDGQLPRAWDDAGVFGCWSPLCCGPLPWYLKGGAVGRLGGGVAAFLFATWYGLAPLTERLAITTIEEEGRFQVFALMFADFPLGWWLSGVGLGAFEAVFKQIQPGDLGGVVGLCPQRLAAWVLGTGLVGIAVLGLVLAGIVRNAAIRLERIPLYAGLSALVVVGLGDFSWHIPATQVVLAIFLGVILQPPPRRKNPPVNDKSLHRRRRRRSPEFFASENTGFK